MTVIKIIETAKQGQRASVHLTALEGSPPVGLRIEHPLHSSLALLTPGEAVQLADALDDAARHVTAEAEAAAGAAATAAQIEAAIRATRP